MEAAFPADPLALTIFVFAEFGLKLEGECIAAGEPNIPRLAAEELFGLLG